MLTGLEGKSSKNQLKTLYDFFVKIPHNNEVLFVWDCDVNEYRNLGETNKTNVFVFQKNEYSNISKNGIENLFSEDLFTDEYIKKVTIEEAGNEKIEKTFPESQKNNFLKFVLERNNKDDFNKFKILLEKVRSLL